MTLPALFDAEASLLALMIDPSCHKWCRYAVRPEWFSSSTRRDMFLAAMEHHEDGTGFCLVDWAKALSRRSNLPFIECCQAIAEVTEHIAAPLNIGAYAKNLREDYERGKLAAGAAGALDKTRDPASVPLDIAAALRTAADIARERHSDDIALDDALEAEANRERTGVVATGFSGLDRMLDGGLAPGTLTVIGGRTSMGKTAMGLELLRHSVSAGVPTGIVSLEMRPAALWKRLQPFRSDRARVWYPKARVSASEIHGKVRQWSADGLGLVIVDHLQKIKSPEARSLYEGMTATVHELAAVATSCDIPLVLLSQLSRQVTGRSEHWPELSDLKDTGAIEEDADAVILLHRPGYYEQAGDQSEAYAILAKNREGMTGTVRLDWRAGRFYNHGANVPQLPAEIEAAREDF